MAASWDSSNFNGGKIGVGGSLPMTSVIVGRNHLGASVEFEFGKVC
jgi:hypothetical protein